MEIIESLISFGCFAGVLECGLSVGGPQFPDARPAYAVESGDI